MSIMKVAWHMLRVKTYLLDNNIVHATCYFSGKPPTIKDTYKCNMTLNLKDRQKYSGARLRITKAPFMI